MSHEKPREIALRVLQLRQRGTFVERLLDAELAPTRMNPRDRSLCQELVYGAVRWQATLDWLIARKTSGRTQKPVLQNVLRLGLYQIFWLERIPNHAAVNETVELAKQSGFGSQARFINAVLRGYLRELEPTRQLLNELRTQQPALGHSHPEWLVARWQEHWGPEATRRLLAWDNIPPKTFARVNTLLADAGKLLSRWREEGVDYDFIRHDWLAENLVFELKAHPPLPELPSFKEGWFYIQDPSTLLAPALLAPQSGEHVLDLCAAPGGKLTFLAQLVGNTGTIIAQDPDPDRLKLIEENCRRLSISCVSLQVSPSAARSLSTAPGMKLQQLPRSFDKILVDAPCSNTGVIRRRVDLRWRIQPKEIQRLSLTQIGLLRQAVPLLKPGGTLVYSTCSLEPEENEFVVNQILAERPELELAGTRELLPFREDVDGAYVAKLQHKN